MQKIIDSPIQPKAERTFLAVSELSYRPQQQRQHGPGTKTDMFIKVSKNTFMEKSIQQMVLLKLYKQQKTNHPCLSLCQKPGQKWTKDLNLKPKILKLLEGDGKHFKL